jgi:hypothetical protein
MIAARISTGMVDTFVVTAMVLMTRGRRGGGECPKTRDGREPERSERNQSDGRSAKTRAAKSGIGGEITSSAAARTPARGPAIERTSAQAPIVPIPESTTIPIRT